MAKRKIALITKAMTRECLTEQKTHFLSRPPQFFCVSWFVGLSAGFKEDFLKQQLFVKWLWEVTVISALPQSE